MYGYIFVYAYVYVYMLPMDLVFNRDFGVIFCVNVWCVMCIYVVFIYLKQYIRREIFVMLMTDSVNWERLILIR